MHTECEFDPDHLYHDHREADALRAKIERLRIEVAQAHWDTRKQQRVNSDLQAALEVYASTSNWDGYEWRGEHNGWVIAQRALARE